MKNHTLKLLSIILFSLSIFSCKKETKNVTETVPVLVTPSNTDVGNITDSTATINASVSSEGGATITAKGVCWSTSHNPTIADHKTTNRQGSGNTVTNKTDNGEGISNFTAILTGLSAQTTYYIRVYATNSLGTGYSNEITITTTGVLDNTCIDIDGNVYQTVTIGTQVWMKENLKTTRYNDGSAIATNLNNAAWSTNTSGAYAIYNNDVANNTTYGKLYNWYAVNTGKLAPAGWHVPTQTESFYLADSGGGGGFSLLASGYRADDGSFIQESNFAIFWTQSTGGAGRAQNVTLSTTNPDDGSTSYERSEANGFSIRCIKN